MTRLEQLEYKLEKNNSDLETYRKKLENKDSVAIEHIAGYYCKRGPFLISPFQS